MRNLMILFTATIFSASISFADGEQVDDGSVEIKIDPTINARIEFLEDTWNFGSIPLNSVVTHDFPIRNNGTDTLVITAVKPTCGCTTAPLESDRIAPGETTDLHVSLNTKKLNGLVRKFINIECNDPISPYSRISFNAVINDPKQVIISSPNSADFGNTIKGEKATARLKLTNKGEEDLKLSVLTYPDEKVIALSFGETSLKAGKETEVTFELSDDFGPAAVVSSVTLEAEGRPETRITIPITGTVVE